MSNDIETALSADDNNEDGKFQHLDNVLADKDKLLMLLREFPMALERYLEENDGQLPKLKVLPSIKESADGVFENDNVTTMFCVQNTTNHHGGIWSLLGGVFCFGSQEEVEFDTIGQDNNNDNNNNNNSNKKSNKKKNKSTKSIWKSKESNKKQAVIESLKSKVIINNDMKKFSKDLVDESRRLFKIYLGLERIEGLNFNWVWKIDKNGVVVHTATVEGSSWLAVKSDSICKADKYTICKLLVDDARTVEYDNGVDGYEIIYRLDDNSCIRRYWYKAVWPVAARDFVTMTCWTELNDGCIMISTISPPPNYYPAKECKNNKDTVRAIILSSGAFIRPLDDSVGGGCAITFVTHCDIGGTVPSSLLNMMIVGTPVRTMTKVVELSEAYSNPNAKNDKKKKKK